MLLFRFCKNTKWNFLLYLKILKIVYPSLNMDIATLYPDVYKRQVYDNDRQRVPVGKIFD